HDNVGVQPFLPTLPRVTPDWHFKAAADIDMADAGDAEILWQNDNGAVVIWKLAWVTVSGIHELPNPGPTWHIVGDNDFNGDGADDILFQNDNGAVSIWTNINLGMGTAAEFAGTQNPGPAWHVVGTGDTRGLGVAGILWQNDNGALALWE